MKWTQQEIDFLKSNQNLSVEEIANEIGKSYDAIKGKLNRLGLRERKTPLTYQEKKHKAKQKQYAEILEEKVDTLLKEREVMLKIRQTPDTIEIAPKHKTSVSEGVPVIVASDWHVEELVKSSTVNGLNSFNLKIAEERAVKFFQSTLRLLQIQRRDVKMDYAVLALLGDFISGSIHDELMENNQLLPGEALWKAQGLIISGIDFLLKNTDLKFVVPCHSGNHGRMTKKQRHSTEAGNSLETLMYYNLDLHYRNNKRIQFLISDSYHSYVDILETQARFHHGHNVKFGGGVGGIYIPTNKAINQWNKAKSADVDFFGHFHSLKDGGNFVCNGSLIGWNPYAISIKADFEKPKQAMTMIYKKHGKGGTFPIWLQS